MDQQTTQSLAEAMDHRFAQVSEIMMDLNDKFNELFATKGVQITEMTKKIETIDRVL